MLERMTAHASRLVRVDQLPLRFPRIAVRVNGQRVDETLQGCALRRLRPQLAGRAAQGDGSAPFEVELLQSRGGWKFTVTSYFDGCFVSNCHRFSASNAAYASVGACVGSTSNGQRALPSASITAPILIGW